ncbi:hypothetical protein J416_06450 [Gracilibacillus halophilus YIM-C55.5]|uniref:Uncharacterized protein n=1 Tax=Gracilibacillus halophilus YIM-C55.5 TaxID=1308866 RepID=N4WAB7_9BACI|nr:DUF2651 family protein [Gracilibacillus halophilus]ENH97253.1 hypothetical protein J416_06450 [Gracilibacillus halophilus YIM-C55.5]
MSLSIQNWVNQLISFVGMIIITIGIYSLMMSFGWNEFQSILIIYPIAVFVIGLVYYVLCKSLWIGPVAILIGGIFSVFLFMNTSFWIWTMIYTVISLLGSLVGKAVRQYHKQNA